jgi:DNA-binding PadR family transcriptional regulator
MENTSVSQDIKDIVEGIRKVVTKSLVNNPFQQAQSANQPDLELAVLAALSTGAKNGAQVVSHIQRSSAGIYTPSQAAVQSVLESLIEKRWAKIVVREDLRLHELTKAGISEFESRELPTTAANSEHQHTSKCVQCESKNWAPHAGVLASGARLAQTVAEASVASHGTKHHEVVELLDQTRTKLQALLAEKN